MIVHTARCTREQGFTLIEILIVIVLISIISSVALITVSNNSKKQLEIFAHQITRTLVLAEEEAMLRSVTLGVAFSKNYFQFFEYVPSDSDKSPWKALTNKSLGFHAIPNHTNISMSVPLDGKPHIIISASGDITPFTMAIATRGNHPDYEIKGDASGYIHVENYHEKT